MEEYRNKYIWITPPYVFVVGILYLWGYWSSFNINVFEYAELSDLIKVAIIPVGSVFFFILLGFFLGEVTITPKIAKRGGENTAFSSIMAKTKWIWISVYWLIVLFLIFTDLPGKWIVLPMIGMFFPYFILKKSLFLSEITSDSVRTLMIMSISILPIYSFCEGKQNAVKVLDSVKYLYTPSIAGLQKAKYVGHVAGYVFFVSQDNNRVVVQRTNETPLLLIANTNQNEPNKPMHAEPATLH